MDCEKKKEEGVMSWLPEIRFINMKTSAEIGTQLKSQLMELFDSCPDASHVVTYIERVADAIRVNISVKAPTGKFSGSGFGESEISAFTAARKQLKTSLDLWKRSRNFDEVTVAA